MVLKFYILPEHEALHKFDFPGSFELIHSADPQSRPWPRPVLIIVFAHVVRPSVRPSVHPHFSKSSQTKQAKTMFTTGETVGLAEWIIDGFPGSFEYNFFLHPSFLNAKRKND